MTVSFNQVKIFCPDVETIPRNRDKIVSWFKEPPDLETFFDIEKIL